MSRVTIDAERLTTPIQAALTYATFGWPVFPCHAPVPKVSGCTCGHGHCSSPGKHPMVRNGLHAASVDLKQIRRWWHRWPTANVGVRTGEISNLVVLDVDPRHGGLDTLRELLKKHGALPSTMTVSTGSDGLHFYFQHPGGG